MVSFFFPMWASETAFYSTFSTPDLVFSPFASPVEELMADFTIAAVPHQHVGGCFGLPRSEVLTVLRRILPASHQDLFIFIFFWPHLFLI